MGSLDPRASSSGRKEETPGREEDDTTVGARASTGPTVGGSLLARGMVEEESVAHSPPVIERLFYPLELFLAGNVVASRDSHAKYFRQRPVSVPSAFGQG